MRALFCILLFLPGPAWAWSFSSDPVCRLDHEEAGLEIALIFDPRRDEPYEIALTAESPWPETDLFGLRFSGGRTLSISTGRHVLSPGRQTLSVSDRGFGNVLNGLEFNSIATAIVGDRATTFSLEGAAEPVQAFRACLVQPAV